MAESIPVDVSPAPCPVDVTSVPPSSVESDTFVFMEKTHPNQMLEKLNRLRLNNTLCDVILCCGGKQFPCHRTVLASFSSYFEKMFTTGMKESRQEKVDMMDVEPQEIDLLVGYAYTSQLIISSDNVKALLAASNLLGVTAVQEACCHYMERQMDMKNCVGIHCFAELHSCQMLMKHSMDYILEHFSVVYQQEEFLSLSVGKMAEILAMERHMDMKNCVEIHCFAELHSCQMLMKHSMDYILEHFSDVYQQEEFISLTKDKLTEILANDDLNVSKEELVFDAAMLWLNQMDSYPYRRESFDQVMEHIRLAFINSSYFELYAFLGETETRVVQRLSKVQNHRPRRSTLTDSREVILMLGGWEGKKPCCSIQTLDPVTYQWKTLGCLPFAVWSPGLVASGSMLYLAGGKLIDGSISREMWRYDTSCDSWLKMAPMNEARWDFGLVMLDGSMYAMGGFKGQLDKWKSVDRYDFNSNTWQLLDSVGLPVNWDGSAVVALDGLIYAFGHIIGGPQMFKYNPHTCVWTETARPYLDIADSAACTLKGRIYVIGGVYYMGEYEDDEGSASAVMVYKPQDTHIPWHHRASMAKLRASPSVVVVDQKIYVLGGSSRTITSQHPIERYDDNTDWWMTVGKKPQGRSAFSCVSVMLRKDTSEQAERKQITCTKCNREFRSKGGLKNHSRRCNAGQSTQPQYPQSDSEYDSEYSE